MTKLDNPETVDPQADDAQPKQEGALLRKVQHETVAGVGGAVAGAAMGAIAGPPGIVAGAVLGAIIGAVTAGIVEDDNTVLADHDRQLDDAIGVNGGTLGAANLKHPPAKAGLYSSASAGVGGAGGGESNDSAGPIQTPD